jgi:hypothetical protein
MSPKFKVTKVFINQNYSSYQANSFGGVSVVFMAFAMGEINLSVL